MNNDQQKKILSAIRAGVSRHGELETPEATFRKALLQTEEIVSAQKQTKTR
ncbi:MAG: hypothetical protein ABGY29_03180 [bacterium]